MAIVTSKFVIQQSVTETPAANNDLTTASNVSVSGLNKSRVRNPSSTPSVTAEGFGTVTLVAGAGTLDLSAMTGINGAAVNGTGLKIRSFIFFNPGVNPMTVSKGASNGHTGLGAAYSQLVAAGCPVAGDLGANGVTIVSGNKTLDVAGTGTDVLKYHILLG